MALFEFLHFFPDRTPRTGPAQMALDEALLGQAGRPILRSYLWAAEAVTFGCGQSCRNVRQGYPDRPLTRRWTGGGIVEHGRDWTFSLIVPREEPLAAKRPAETYEQIHHAVRSALASCHFSAHLARPEECSTGPACFHSPALHDVLGEENAKLCGGAQRRTRLGFLHQGSIQCPGLPDDFGERLAQALARKISLFAPDAPLLSQAEDLAEKKYGCPDWLERIP